MHINAHTITQPHPHNACTQVVIPLKRGLEASLEIKKDFGMQGLVSDEILKKLSPDDAAIFS
jgi:hypothetical protein